MDWLISNFHVILATLLSISEGLAAAVQIFCPENKGVSGILAGIIKLLQSRLN